LRVTVLGSGSAGNAALVESGDTCVLVDAGFSGRDLERRLAEVSVDPASLAGILITHDHGDHTRGMGVLARRFGLPLYLTPRTQAVCTKMLDGTERIEAYTSASPFRIGSLEVHPFLTVHDAADPVAVTITEVGTGHKLGIATDLGRPTATVRQALAGCHLLVLESNHDESRLWQSGYPWSVKQRIASSHGHLSNRASAELARELFHAGLAGVVLAHLSEQCNAPALAAEVVGETLEALKFSGLLQVAPQGGPLEPIDVERLRMRAQPVQLSLL
jgi:phosphoribosyl 1,2-cyclic phosphodiesterase